MIEKDENKEYLPMQGLDSFRKATVDLLLGADNPAIKEVRPQGAHAHPCGHASLRTAPRARCRARRRVSTPPFASVKRCSQAVSPEVMMAQSQGVERACAAQRSVDKQQRWRVQGRVACLQSLSGTGSLRVGAQFIQAWLPGKTMYISNPTWGNHRNIFSDAGLEWKYYRCARLRLRARHAAAVAAAMPCCGCCWVEALYA